MRANDSITAKAEAAFRQAAADVVKRARETGTPIILWENGKIVRRSWEEFAWLETPGATKPGEAPEVASP